MFLNSKIRKKSGIEILSSFPSESVNFTLSFNRFISSDLVAIVNCWGSTTRRPKADRAPHKDFSSRFKPRRKCAKITNQHAVPILKQENCLTSTNLWWQKKLIMASDVTEAPRLILAVAVSVQWAASYHVLPSAETLDLQFGGSVRN